MDSPSCLKKDDFGAFFVFENIVFSNVFRLPLTCLGAIFKANWKFNGWLATKNSLSILNATERFLSS